MGRHLLFVWSAAGYELLERAGEPPAPGAEVDLGDDGRRFFVSKVGPSPLPDDDRPCAYLQRL